MYTLSRLRLPIAVIVGLAFAVIIALAAFSSTASATHKWSKYHWARTSNAASSGGFKVELGDNVADTLTSEQSTSKWQDHLNIASGYLQNADESPEDWHESSKLNVPVVAGSTTGKDCTPKSGRVEVCNAAYGENGWLGLAQIWLTGPHIKQGAAKNNDTYFDRVDPNKTDYNKPEWRQSVMCQEIGHTFGLGHVNEDSNNTNTGSCMDYTNDPDGSSPQTDNRYPNQHDYDMLDSIYRHFDNFNTIGSTSATSGMPSAMNRGDLNRPDQWGRRIHTAPNGRTELWERDFGSGRKVLTLVILADREDQSEDHHQGQQKQQGQPQKNEEEEKQQ